MPKFHVTYDIITPESAEHADAAERGFIDTRGRHVDLPDGVCGEPAGAIMGACGLSLRQAIEEISCVHDGGDGYSYYEADPRCNYRTGHEESRAFHLPDNTTTASVARVARLLRSRRLLLR
jgi:hypothetical protein